MKTIATFPAFSVVDLELDVMNIEANMLKEGGFRFCVAKETARHGTQYPEVKPGCIAYFSEEMGEPEKTEERTARAIARGDKIHWLNLCGSSLTAHRHAEYTMFILKAGQKVKMDGKLLEVVDAGRGYWDLKEVK